MLVGVSSSPYVAIACLVAVSVYLSVQVGIRYISWFFFTLVIVYVGGIIVIFIYLSRLIQSAKITLVGARGPLGGGLLLGLRARVNFWIALGKREAELWVTTSFTLSRAPLAGLGALYLLGALVRVYRLCQKGEGPIKRF